MALTTIGKWIMNSCLGCNPYRQFPKLGNEGSTVTFDDTSAGGWYVYISEELKNESLQNWLSRLPAIRYKTTNTSIFQITSNSAGIAIIPLVNDTANDITYKSYGTLYKASQTASNTFYWCVSYFEFPEPITVPAGGSISVTIKLNASNI